jgi:NitT/TauT family transport system permease protein
LKLSINLSIKLKSEKYLSKLTSEKRIVQLFAFILFFILWEIVGRAVGSFFLAPPTAVSGAVRTLLGEAQFLADLQLGLLSLLLGVFLGVFLGMMFGVGMGISESIKYFFDPYITILYGFPFIALIPFIVLIFDTGLMPRVFIIFLLSFIPMTINSLEGAEQLPAQLKEVGLCYGANTFEIIRTLFFPSMVPHLLSGGRLAVGRGLRGWILAELFFNVGVGGRLVTYGYQLRTDFVFAILVIFIIIGTTANHSFYLLSKVLAPWYEDEGVNL